MVKQRNDSDCGVACIAMLIQRYDGCTPESSYERAKAAIFNDAEGGLTGTRELKQALRKFGIKVGYRSVPFRRASQMDMNLDFDAIVS